MDEPTNHLDLEAVETLEAALNGYDGAMIVVSTDETFLDHIGIERSYELGIFGRDAFRCATMGKTSPHGVFDGGPDAWNPSLVYTAIARVLSG